MEEDDIIILNGNSRDNTLTYTSEDSDNVSATGGLGSDSISIDGDANEVTVFGGEGFESPTDNSDTITVAANSAFVYGNGGNDSIDIDVDDAATVFGGVGDDSITVTSDEGAAVSVVGGEEEDTITITAADGDVTVFGGTGGADSTDGDDSIAVGTLGGGVDTALVFGNGGQDNIEVFVDDDATVLGGVGDDTIDVTATDDIAEISVVGGEDEDSITVNADEGDVTVFGGIGPADPTDGDDTITVGSDGEGASVDSAVVFGNGGNDSIDVFAEEDASVVGGLGDDSITVVAEGETIGTVTVPAEDVNVFGSEGEDTVGVTTDASNVTVSGGVSTDGTANVNSDNGDQVTVAYTGTVDTDVSEILLVGSTGDDLLTFTFTPGAGDDTVDNGVSATIDGGGTSDIVGEGSNDIVIINTVQYETDEAGNIYADDVQLFDGDDAPVQEGDTFEVDGVDVTIINLDPTIAGDGDTAPVVTDPVIIT